MRKIILSILAMAGLVLGLAGAAYATSTDTCTDIRDHITKPDTGHGAPAEWADLSLSRLVTVCRTDTGYTATLTDAGTLWTRVEAGTPNGTGGTISHRVRGTVHGVYQLTVTGGTLAHRHGDVAKSSTEYVRSLFSPDAQVVGGDYRWTYETVCKERWVDASFNNDGQGEQAGNITGKRCPKPRPRPTSPSPTSTATPSPTPTTSPATDPDEAPAPTPVRSDLPVTG